MGPAPGQLHNPQFIAIHRRTHQLYVTDSSNHRVCVFDHNGNLLFQFGQEGFHSGQLKFPRGIAVDDQVSPSTFSPEFVVVGDSFNFFFIMATAFTLLLGFYYCCGQRE